jgi:hypothetical protein
VAEADEDIALTESEARVWRRKLDSRRKNRLQNTAYVGHDHVTSKGAVRRCGGGGVANPARVPCHSPHTPPGLPSRWIAFQSTGMVWPSLCSRMMVTEMGQSPQGVSFLATADWLTNLLLPPRCYLCVPIPARMLRAQSAAWDRVSRDEMETSSYYERQQRKYGRSRRGSTSYHGALELLLSQTAGQRSEEDKVRGGSPHTVPFCALTHSQAQLPCEHAPTSGLAPARAAVLGPHGCVCAALSLVCVCVDSLR